MSYIPVFSYPVLIGTVHTVMPASSRRLIQYLVCSGFGSIIIESGSDSPPPPPKPGFAINPEPDPVPEPGSRPEFKTSFFS